MKRRVHDHKYRDDVRRDSDIFGKKGLTYADGNKHEAAEYAQVGAFRKLHSSKEKDDRRDIIIETMTPLICLRVDTESRKDKKDSGRQEREREREKNRESARNLRNLWKQSALSRQTK